MTHSKPEKIKNRRKRKEITEINLGGLYMAAKIHGGKREICTFLENLVSPALKSDLDRRVIVAQMLLRGELPGEIARDLGVGRAIVRKVEKWLNESLNECEQTVILIEKKLKEKGILARKLR